MSAAIEGSASSLARAAAASVSTGLGFGSRIALREGDFRLCTMMLIEEIVESLCVQTPIIIQNVCVLLGDHRSLRMTGIALDRLYITATQFQLVCHRCMTQAVKYHIRQSFLFNNLLHLGTNMACANWHTKSRGKHQVIILIFISKDFLCMILLCFQLLQTFPT